MVKVFISHQSADSDLAQKISWRLKLLHSIDSYLDVIDPNVQRSGEDLGEYIRQKLSECTQLLAVVSDNTKQSWWVPWEIGISTEKYQPIATYARANTPLPEYLKKWPYLTSDFDLDLYANASKAFDSNVIVRKRSLNESLAKHYSTSDFYKSLSTSLGQRYAA